MPSSHPAPFLLHLPTIVFIAHLPPFGKEYAY